MVTMTGETVSQMEADLHAANIRVENLERHNALLSQENNQLRQSESKARTERDDAIIQCAEMQAIMEQVSAGLVSGLGRMGFTKRQRQERELGVGGPDAPFKPTKSFVDHVQGVADRLMVPMEQDRPNRPTRVDQSLADRDSRLPKLTPVNLDELQDREDLAAINDRIAARAQR